LGDTWQKCLTGSAGIRRVLILNHSLMSIIFGPSSRPSVLIRRSIGQGMNGSPFPGKTFVTLRTALIDVGRMTKPGVVEGKGSWFPLLEASVKASWDNRCDADEQPVLLDPVKQKDVDLIDVEADGRMRPSRLAIGTAKTRVTESCKFYGLNLPAITSARKRIMREVQELTESLVDTIGPGSDEQMADTLADRLPVRRLQELIRAKTLPNSPYSKAARAMVINSGWAVLLPKPEEVEEMHAA
jgi:hypothetical protein